VHEGWDDDARDRLGLLMDVRPAQAIAVLNHLGVADLLKEGPRRVGELAAACDVHERTLYRLLRYAAMHGVFSEIEPESFTLTPMAAFLRSDAPQSRYWHVGGPTAMKPWYAWDDWMETVRTGEPAYDRAHGRSYWDTIREDEAFRAAFQASLREIAARQVPAVLPMVDLGAHRVQVDVGAGEGSWTAALLQRWPTLRAVCFEVAASTAALGATLELAGVADRAEVVTGDFLEQVPAGDVVLVANVLHDWDDEQAARILSNCAEALEERGELIIVDRVLPEGDVPHPGKSVDINMLFNVGGRERTLREFDDLLASAGLSMSEHAGTASGVSVIRSKRSRGS